MNLLSFIGMAMIPVFFMRNPYFTIVGRQYTVSLIYGFIAPFLMVHIARATSTDVLATSTYDDHADSNVSGSNLCYRACNNANIFCCEKVQLDVVCCLQPVRALFTVRMGYLYVR